MTSRDLAANKKIDAYLAFLFKDLQRTAQDTKASRRTTESLKKKSKTS